MAFCSAPCCALVPVDVLYVYILFNLGTSFGKMFLGTPEWADIIQATNHPIMGFLSRFLTIEVTGGTNGLP